MDIKLPDQPFACLINNEIEFKKFLSKLDDMGYKWRSGKNALHYTYFKRMPIIIYVDDDKISYSHEYGGHSWKYGDLIENIFANDNKIKKLDIDPFNEENWGYIQEKLTIDFKDVFIPISSKEEHNFLMYYLFNNTKCVWANGRVPLDEFFWDNYPNIYINNDLKMYRTRTNNRNSRIINIKEKFKRVKNKEVDPFGEENWGYEII